MAPKSEIDFLQNEDFSLMIIVPEAKDGLTDLVQGLSEVTISNIRGYGSLEEVEVYLPKFKVESTISLKEPLEQVTMTKVSSQISHS